MVYSLVTIAEQLGVPAQNIEDAGHIGKYRSESSRAYELFPFAETLVPPVFEAVEERAEIA